MKASIAETCFGTSKPIKIKYIMETINETYAKMQTITNILLLQEKIVKDYAVFTFNDLINCELWNLEAIRDEKIKIYNNQF